MFVFASVSCRFQDTIFSHYRYYDNCYKLIKTGLVLVDFAFYLVIFVFLSIIACPCVDFNCVVMLCLRFSALVEMETE